MDGCTYLGQRSVHFVSCFLDSVADDVQGLENPHLTTGLIGFVNKIDQNLAGAFEVVYVPYILDYDPQSILTDITFSASYTHPFKGGIVTTSP